jgi:hypothetical protein
MVRAEDTAGNVSEQEWTFTVVDDVAPEVTITSPEARAYGHHEVVPVEVEVSDARSAVSEVVVELDGQVVTDDEIDLAGVALGQHTLTVTATDAAGNVASDSVTFTVEATLASLRGLVERYAEAGLISPETAATLLERLDVIDGSVERGALRAADNQLAALAAHVEAQAGKSIAAEVASLLLVDIEAVREED